MRQSRFRITTAVAVLVLATPMLVNAAPSPRSTGFCDSFLSFLCPAPGSAPEPTPSTPEDLIDPLIPDSAVPETPGGTATPAPEEAPVPAPVDGGAPIFTGTPAAMGAGGLSFTGLQGISIVSVPTIDGSTVRALKISAESITITGFSLTVRPPDGPGLVTTADTMSLQGNVSVYLGSVTATTVGGAALTLGVDTPPSLEEVEPGLLSVSLGLVGSIADSITYTNTDQHIVELE